MENIAVFSLTSNKKLTAEICQYLGIKEGEISVTHFKDGEVLVEPQESVRGKHVFLVQSTCAPANDRIMELLIACDAIKRGSCKELTCVIPYYGYARQDRKARARQPITSRLVADIIQSAGVDRVICIDLHAAQIQGFFKIPSDNMTAMDMIGQYFRTREDIDTSNIVVVSPDHGGVTRARKFADNVDGAPIAIVDKRRPRPNVSEAVNLIGDVDGKDCIIVDDIVDTGGTLLNCVKILKDHGAKRVYCACTHGVLNGDSLKNIAANKDVEEFVITNTIEHDIEKTKGTPNLKILSVAFMLSKCIESVANNSPISDVYELFHEEKCHC